jgi:hypothetical protein
MCVFPFTGWQRPLGAVVTSGVVSVGGSDGPVGFCVGDAVLMAEGLLTRGDEPWGSLRPTARTRVGSMRPGLT